VPAPDTSASLRILILLRAGLSWFLVFVSSKFVISPFCSHLLTQVSNGMCVESKRHKLVFVFVYLILDTDIIFIYCNQPVPVAARSKA